MSDAQTPRNPTPDNGHQKKPRSPVERAIVWGGISILLIVAGIQGMAAYGFSTSKDKIAAAVKRADDSSNELSLNEAEELMSGIWSKTPIQKTNYDRFVIYSWTGVYQSYTILLNVGADATNPTVVGYELNSETSSHTESLLAEHDQNAGGATDEIDDATAEIDMPMGMGGGAGGDHEHPGGGHEHQGGGGRPSINWDELDKDGDGKISKEEAPERMQQFFDHIDTSGDGFIDEAEREAMRQRFAARRNSGGEGRGPGGGGRPQRPTNDDDPPAATTPDEPKSNPDEPDPPKKPEEASPQESNE